MLGWIDPVEPARQHGDGSAAQSRAVRARIDPARKTGGDDEILRRQFAGHALGKGEASGGRVARADDGDRRTHEDGQVAQHDQHRRRRVDGAQAWRKIVLAEAEQFRAEAHQRLIFTLDGVPRGDGDRPAAALGEFRQSFKRWPRAAITVDQRTKGARADVFAADEAQPVEALGVR